MLWPLTGPPTDRHAGRVRDAQPAGVHATHQPVNGKASVYVKMQVHGRRRLPLGRAARSPGSTRSLCQGRFRSAEMLFGQAAGAFYVMCKYGIGDRGMFRGQIPFIAAQPDRCASEP